MKTIEITEEVKIPQKDGSIFVLESGDKIQIKESVFNKVSDLLPWLEQAEDIRDFLIEATENDIEINMVKTDYFDKNRNSATIYIDMMSTTPNELVEFLQESRAFRKLNKLYNVKTDEIELTHSQNSVAYKIQISE